MPIDPEPSPWIFPPPEDWDPDDDMVALGADLTPGTVLEAYATGLFPMPTNLPGSPMGWFSPVRRGVLPLDAMVVSRSLRRSARDFEIRVDTAFEEVIDACGRPDRPDGWITASVRTAYVELHRLGWAHSVEAWRDDRLVGGLYGIGIGGLFAGESMFHVERDASKAALMGLVDLLGGHSAEHGPPSGLLDVQWRTDHLASLGVVEIGRDEYLARLAAVIDLPDVFDGSVAN